MLAGTIHDSIWVAFWYVPALGKPIVARATRHRFGLCSVARCTWCGRAFRGTCRLEVAGRNGPNALVATGDTHGAICRQPLLADALRGSA